MAKIFNEITPELVEFISSQHIFFVATSPLAASGHVNLSPKGLDSFLILTPNQVAYLDLTGSGNETSTHIKENGRITFMFCAFQGIPKILRLYGCGRVVIPSCSNWEELYSRFPQLPGTRQIIVADIEIVQTSCGSGVPLYEYHGQRNELIEWASKKGEKALQEYQVNKNTISLDGLISPLGDLFNSQ